MPVGDVDLEGMYVTPVIHHWIIIAKKPGFTSEFTSDPEVGQRFEQLGKQWPDTFAVIKITHGTASVTNATAAGFLNAYLPRTADGFQYTDIPEATMASKDKIV